MTTFSGYTNNASYPNLSSNNIPRNDFRFRDQPNPRQQHQLELEARLQQLKKESADAFNPYYDNTFQHNRNIYRENIQNASLDQKQNLPTNRNSIRGDQQQNGRSYEQDHAPRDSKQDLKQIVQGSFFDNFGQNKRHDLLQREYRDFVRGGAGNQSQEKYPKNTKWESQQSPDEQRRNRSRDQLRKGRNQELPNGEDWYVKNYNVGILPGMGKTPEVQRSSQPDRFQNNPSNWNDRRDDFDRGVARNDTAPKRVSSGYQERHSLNPSGSRLAGIGSRLVDGNKPFFDDQKSFAQKLDEIKPPSVFEDYGNLAQRRDIYQNVSSNKSPLDRRVQERLEFPNYHGFIEKNPDVYIDRGFDYDADNYFRKKAGSVKDLDDFRDWKENRGFDAGFDQRKFPPMKNEENTYHMHNQEDQNLKKLDTGRGEKKEDWLQARESEEMDKKQKQKLELQRIYQEQMDEKKRKKEAEKMKERLEDQKEEERLRRENEELQKEYAREQQKKKDQEMAKENFQAKMEAVLDDFTEQSQARKKQGKQQNRAFQTSDENLLKRDAQKNEPKEDSFTQRQYEPAVVRVEDLVKESAKMFAVQGHYQRMEEISRDPEFEVHKAVMRRMDANLDEQLEKMKRDLTNHTRLLREDQNSYQQQAIVSRELRENAQRELMRLRDNLKMQHLDKEYRNQQEINLGPQQSFVLSNQQPQQFSSLKPSKSQEKIGARISNKNYAKLYPVDEDVDFEISVGRTLDVDTHYVPIQDFNGHFNSKQKPNLPNDNVKNRFEVLFPDHSSKAQQSHMIDARNEVGYQSTLKELRNQAGSKQGPIEGNEYRYKYMKGPTETRQSQKLEREAYQNFEEVDGVDEIERLDKMLMNYREKINEVNPKQSSRKMDDLRARTENETQKNKEPDFDQLVMNDDDEQQEKDMSGIDQNNGRVESKVEQLDTKENNVHLEDERNSGRLSENKNDNFGESAEIDQ